MTENEKKTLRDSFKMTCAAMRSLGYAIVVYNPLELGSLSPRELEEELVMRGNELLPFDQSLPEEL